MVGKFLVVKFFEFCYLIEQRTFVVLILGT